MRIRRYTGKDAQEAMLKVKMDLGSEAIILSTRKVRKKGIAGLFSKPLTEVLAAIDEDYGNKKVVTEPVKKPRTGLTTYNRTGELQPEDNRVESLESRMKQMEIMLESIYNSVGKGQNKNPDTQKKEAENREAYEASATHAAKENRTAFSKQKIEQGQEAGKRINSKDSEALALFRRNLADNDIEPLIIDKMVDKITQFVQNPESYEEIALVAEKILVKVLGQPQGIQFREDQRPTVVLFIGPTGVGKTTTLAKIAADYSLNHPKKVGLITADTYRIAAVEQLKTYAEILNIPVSVIYSPQEVEEAILEHEDKDLILIDTAGRSHKNAVQFSELKMLVSAAKADEVYLVLNASMGRAACRDIIAQYSFLQKYKLLFTKLDEAVVPGMILNVRYATGRQLSYTTAGQSVPDDIEIANIEAIVKNMIYGKETGG
ncbi:MAG: flagellar biosynthesis protein FlhF [Clostridiaceae bacterium]|jgi:flagellar biosynthesis protein FlhF|nr:flagellar biosynthesis protein FlhF [Clostridiaceae bacterium]